MVILNIFVLTSKITLIIWDEPHLQQNSYQQFHPYDKRAVPLSQGVTPEPSSVVVNACPHGSVDLLITTQQLVNQSGNVSNIDYTIAIDIARSR